MTTIADLRANYVDDYLDRTAGSTVPWTDTRVELHIADALQQLWADGVGKLATGTVAPSQASDVYTIPGGLELGDISRVELEYSSGGISQRVDRAVNWQRYSATQVRIIPRIVTDSTLTLRFFGYVPYSVTGADLPVRLENVVSMKAAGLAYATLAARLTNTQNQQSLDSGRVVDYQTALGLSAYWERRYQDQITRDHSRRSLAPRAAYR